MPKRAPQLVVALLTLSGAIAGQASAVPSQDYRVIVHPGNPITRVARGFVADAFLKKVTRWRDGSVIKPVDLGRTSPVRIHFADQVLGRELQAVRSYWQQQIFSGRDVPPPEFESESAVVSYVLKHPGAIGYVSSAAEIQTARIVRVE